jgi:hypothetical protein
MRYLSFEESALRKLRNSNGVPHGHHAADDGTATSAPEDDGDSSEDEGRNSGSAEGSGGILNMTEFLRQKHDAYKSPTLIVLEGVMDFTHAQFQNNLSWIVPLLSRLIVCEDIEVRLCVRQIYQSFVNFLLIR